MNLAGGQQIQRRLYATAAGTDKRNLIHNDWRSIEAHLSMHSGLQEHCPAGPRHLHGLAQAICRTGCFDNPVIGRGGKVPACDFPDNARPLGDAKLAGVTPELVNFMTSGFQDLCDKQPKLAVSKYRNLGSAWKGCLIQNLAGCRKRFSKDRDFIRNRGGNDVKIDLREGKKFAECAGMPDNSQDLARGTVAPEASPAPIATTAREVYFSDNAAAD